MDIFTNREIAAATWLFLFLIWAFQKADVSSSFFSVIKSLFAWRIIMLIGLMLSYIALIIVLSSYTGFWDKILIKDTIYWTFGAAFIMLLQVNKNSSHDKYFSTLIRSNLKIILLLEFILNFHTFSLLTELIITPIIIALAMVKAYADSYIAERPEYKPVLTLLNTILFMYVISLFIISLLGIISNYESFTSSSTLRSFLLPPLFSILYIPFLYLAALFMKYETVFIRIDINNQDKELAKYYKLKTLQHCHINLNQLNKWSQRINYIGSKNEVQSSIQNLKSENNRPSS